MKLLKKPWNDWALLRTLATQHQWASRSYLVACIEVCFTRRQDTILVEFHRASSILPGYTDIMPVTVIRWYWQFSVKLNRWLLQLFIHPKGLKRDNSNLFFFLVIKCLLFLLYETEINKTNRGKKIKQKRALTKRGTNCLLSKRTSCVGDSFYCVCLKTPDSLTSTHFIYSDNPF